MTRLALVLALTVALGASPAGAQAVPDFEVQSYAQQFGVSEQVARDRLDLQRRGAGIVEKASAALGAAYGGVWFDNGAGRFHVAMTATGNRAAIDRVLADMGIADGTDVDVVAHTLTEIRAAADQAFAALQPWYTQQLLLVGTDESVNGIGIQLARTVTPEQRAAIESALSAIDVPKHYRVADVDAFVFTPLVLATPTPTPAGSTPTTVTLLSGKPKGGVRRLARRTRTVRIRFSAEACGDQVGATRVTVRRKAHRIVITARASVPTTGGPYDVCAGVGRRVERRVKLKGRLGGRDIVDGATRRVVGQPFG